MLGSMTLLGILVQERSPIGYKDLAGQVQTFLQDAGGFAAVGLVLWIVASLFASSPIDPTEPSRKRVSSLMYAMVGLALLLYLSAGVNMFLESVRASSDESVRLELQQREIIAAQNPSMFRGDTTSILLMVAGIFALIGLCDPFVRDLTKLSMRRIWALATIAFKEAYRRRIVWVFCVFLLIFLFPPKWFFNIKAEDELKTNVSAIYWSMTPLLLLTAGLLAAFSIPTDVRSQTIHTIVTKPVQRFEIVLGRFLGFSMLMSVVLFTLTGFSLLLIQTSNVDEAAAEESQKARQPLYGLISFQGNNKDANWYGESVGREWEYRRYIAGGPTSSQRAVWNFMSLPSDLIAGRAAVPLEFAFDIFRTTKGEENRGVLTSLQIVTWQWDNVAKQKEYEQAARDAGVYQQNVDPSDSRWAKVNELARKYGIFEFRNKQVVDYHTQAIQVPTGLFENALDGTPPSNPNAPPQPLVRVLVKCESPTQFLGMAPYDLYFLEGEGSFTLNFFKGAVGLWCRLLIIIGIAVAVSTYLNGIISLLVSVFLILAGFFQDFIADLARGTNYGGGPLESFNRLVRGDNITIELDRTPAIQFAQGVDEGFRWLVRRLLNIIPDIERFNWTPYVAEGFNISGEFLIMNVLFLVAYLLPWAILSYYLMRSREIATW
ncbi:ABC transporter permease [Tuwongella immobilis]|uniref:ABC transporter permease n=1 Tax=Tuwongella immobilis TaxID=692036 RepID=A0A6C2YW50_9BACT|nr:ABC transporter permease subunit [Tuwongella immobilis]VIP05092.1 Uncharacterized protein OS=Planctomyces brasiliensis (strain ATCC 49424 / DSM 5305 / JCM 21570 / NBRC 103401 / IFAM 1448) GN=Plabr_1574 PE=4 SV=1: ABC2_membrane_4 [Tuwongella immobilis]VTS07540.1 Uncharacterized protein OS=Planctomyces brasiliensis (strain ATCC 49424 / DSM 5305 / JCM 21570 / NBRC 103401 / IFAM 1448) GN=Plabr_1574 PE=4 SV=1: ABC2_membrane_4 [Tuwongella immobilis]